MEATYRSRALARLAGRRLWGVAAAFVGADPALRPALLAEMVGAEEGLLAEEYRKQWGLPPDTLGLCAQALEEQVGWGGDGTRRSTGSSAYIHRWGA